MDYSYFQISEQSLEVEFPEQINVEENKIIQSVAREMIAEKAVGVTGVIPAYHTLTINYDFDLTSYKDLVDQVDEIIANLNEQPKTGRTIIELPVCYIQKFGPDLQDVADFGKMSVDELIKMHSETDYFIYMMGFLPGFAYMGSVPKQIAMPRLKIPRKSIAPGSVGIAGEQTGMYPVESPGGWRLLGRTPVKLYDPALPTLKYQSGDYVRFVPIDESDYERIQKLDAAGKYQLNVIKEGGKNNG
ncbi:5-oxoprolinase subunit PxpB [Companilactobacillus sp.]|jgi:KipI family sensor histidine kinase inhibitor|uniref:5-oxoprolinase subunit PxpB n=1 Tax=Companilactobacillus sp. TaxID=2767905 RepID=UPI0025B882BF|nr:5-oxoprolinase subunit PxpB [Companilactobacillus sp.]MCH4009617.1 5-oxoprolinase subunit PxpB [Companilactobacillus sp.]MCH4052707.1 5-oxoprolinase subunit PxpB [Companilactobacillus sp.]MCH4077559.1 5-oxoprolinase subunit PxpB [Companilactobacillus sp.]MCH4126135.1 5-oxoprolinase subunit PxpB [Companilactobacillus sp.]MCI1311843.1 5-oxoprolinase subunit PxpB [Companilactobacillus sp.]